MIPKILLVNPPIYDFSAYDFWLKPYGLLKVAGFLRHQADLKLFDYLDRFQPCLTNQDNVSPAKADEWGRGKFRSEIIPKPPLFSKIPRYYRRFGLPRTEFQKFLIQENTFDFVFIQTVMTYWYPGIQEVIEDIKTYSPNTKIVLGGVYATLCPQHAKGLGADLVIEGLNLEPLWQFIKAGPSMQELPFWEAYSKLDVGIIKLAEGCPFRCTYCSVPQVYPNFIARPLERPLSELEFLCRLGVRNVAFYDDALLYQPQKIIIPFLEKVLERGIVMNFHTPNALNARFITLDLAKLMIRAGFKTFYLGFESDAYEWQKKTGGKVYSDEFARAIENLDKAGTDLKNVSAYLIMAHPQGKQQNVDASMQFAHSLGIQIMLSEFSPIPGTRDGEMCRKWVNLDEPLMHNKTVFPIFFLGESEVNRLKQLCQSLNQNMNSSQLTVYG